MDRIIFDGRKSLDLLGENIRINRKPFPIVSRKIIDFIATPYFKESSRHCGCIFETLAGNQVWTWRMVLCNSTTLNRSCNRCKYIKQNRLRNNLQRIFSSLKYDEPTFVLLPYDAGINIGNLKTFVRLFKELKAVVICSRRFLDCNNSKILYL